MSDVPRSGMEDKTLTAKLAKYKTAKGCLYIRKLDDVDRRVLRDMIRKSVQEMRKPHECE